MYEQEKHRSIHLIILLCYTIFTVVLTGESILLGWDKAAVILIILGLLLSWAIHIVGRFPESTRLWIYYLLTMLAFFFYGIHETSMYDMAAVMVVVIVMYSVTELNSIINMCVVTYYFTMLYDFIFVMDRSVEFTPLMITRLLLHLVLVYMAGYMVKLVMHRRGKEKKLTDERIAELEDINRRTEEFLTNVSHELRTPINAVTGITAVMVKNEDDPNKKRDIVSIQNAGRRLFQQIEDILDYTEIDTGRITVSEEPYMISSLVNDIITGDRLRERENCPEVIFDIDASMPAVLLGDGRKVKKIVKHLVDNAIKFTKTGGVYVRIYAMRKPYGINLCIKVVDTGIGVSEEQLEKITERFYQSNNGSNRRAGGLGLGLPIVYGMTAAMEGFIQMESKVEEGTVVSVSIPQKIADEAPCMTVENPAGLCMACYLRPEKYECPEIRDFYNETISHMVHELELTVHRVSNVDELNRLASIYRLTHLFIGKEEYTENEAYFENMDKNTDVIVVAESSFELPKGSRVKLIKKPFYCLSLVNILNAHAVEEDETFSEKRMVCPGIKVLVVDDEPMNLMVAEGIFKEYQMQVTTAESGRRAIELCKTTDFDLIFLDHMMPEMDGVETLKLLRKIPTDQGRDLTVIAFTANAVSGAREMFRREGFDEFVSKPVEDMELERVLRKVLPKAAITFVDGKTGQHSEQESDADKLARLEAEGVRIRSGLNYCRGDMAFYIELLTRFAQEAERKETEIRDFFAKEDVDNYRIRVHALKSTSKMIGADVFSERARSVEEAAKNHDMNYIREYHDELLKEYRYLSRNIQNALGLAEAAASQGAQAEAKEITKNELIERLIVLKKYLETFEIDKAEDLISEMCETVYQGTAMAGLLGDVKQDVENFDGDAASQKVEKLMSSIEGGEV